MHHFRIAARPGIRGVVLHPWGEVIFRTLNAARAHQLWRSGHPNIHITHKAAAAHYAAASVDERIALLPLCRTADEVEAIVAVRISAKIRRAADKRLEELAG